MIIQVPFPPSVNTYWRTFRGRMIISKAGRDYRKALINIIPKVKEPILEDVSIRIFVTMPDRRRRDLDNLLKAPLDAIQHAGIIKDDYQIKSLHISHDGIVSKPGKLQIIIDRIFK